MEDIVLVYLFRILIAMNLGIVPEHPFGKHPSIPETRRGLWD
jgi:hypothetical protein